MVSVALCCTGETSVISLERLLFTHRGIDEAVGGDQGRGSSDSVYPTTGPAAPRNIATPRKNCTSTVDPLPLRLLWVRGAALCRGSAGGGVVRARVSVQPGSTAGVTV